VSINPNEKQETGEQETENWAMPKPNGRFFISGFRSPVFHFFVIGSVPALPA